MRNIQNREIECLVIGGSAGAIEALLHFLPNLRPNLPLSVVCVLHMAPDSENLLVPIFAEKCKMPVKESESTEALEPGTLYFGPADYHLSLERNKTFSLSTEAPVNYSRPSIDVFFFSAAEAYGDRLAAILLSGANSDGARGLQAIQKHGGLTIVQDPSEAAYETMPQSALDLITPDVTCEMRELAPLIHEICAPGTTSSSQGRVHG